MKRFLIFLLLSLLFCMHSQASSLSLGQIKVLSGLNQPCRLEIPMINPNHVPLKAIKVHFVKPVLRLHSAIRRQGEGEIIRISSRKRITRPYLRVLLQVSSPEGRFRRRFLVLLDPAKSLCMKK